MDKKLSNKKIIASASVLIVILLALFFVYHNFFPKGTEGENITVTVITPDHDPTEIKIKTNAEFLRQFWMKRIWFRYHVWRFLNGGGG